MIKITTLKEWERYAFGSWHIISVCMYVWYNSAADFCPKMFLGKIFESSLFFHCPCHPFLANKTSKPGPENLLCLKKKVHLAIRFLQWKGVQKLKWFPCSKMKQTFMRIARNWNGSDKKLRIIYLVADSDPKGLQAMNWATGIRLWSWWPPKTIKPLTPKIRLLILFSSCCTFPCKLVMRTWCWIKIAASTW